MKKSSSFYPLEPNLTEYTDCVDVSFNCPVCRRGRSNPRIDAILLKEGYTIFLYSKEGKTRPNTNIINAIFNLWISTELFQDCIRNQDSDSFLFLEIFNCYTVQAWVSSLED